MDLQATLVDPFVSFLTHNGWTCLIVSLGVWYLWTLVSPKYFSWQRAREDREWEARLHRDPDAVIRRQEEMDAARRRLQDQYDERARVHAEKLKEKEEKEREKAVADWENHREGKGYRSKTKASDEQEAAAKRAADELNQLGGANSSAASTSRPTRRLRPEFNPLMGQGGARFNPAPRGNVGGG